MVDVGGDWGTTGFDIRYRISSLNDNGFCVSALFMTATLASPEAGSPPLMDGLLCELVFESGFPGALSLRALGMVARSLVPPVNEQICT